LIKLCLNTDTSPRGQATVALSIILGFSSVFLRQRSYEVFLIIHIVLALIVIVALFIHTSYFGTEYNGYLWPTVAIWCFDRFLRLVRLAYCNFNVFSGNAKTTKSSVMYSSASDVIRIDLQPSAKSLKGRPGQFYYLYQPFRLHGWENHPFTLGACTNGLEDVSPKSTENIEKTFATTTITKPSHSTADAVNLYSPTCSTQTLTFWIRPYDGWTKRLRDECIKAGGVCYPKILIEGPYGHTLMMDTYDTITMVMGGTGIACAVPYIQGFLRRSKNGISYTSKIKLVWTVRQPEFVDELCANELAAAMCNSNIELEFYCSKKTIPVGAPVSPDVSNEFIGRPVIQSGRAPIASLIAEIGAEAKLSNSRAAVLVCGPAAMADEARAAVHQSLKKGCRTLDYFEESYGW
jgi:predicted ferric reductase